MPSSAAGQEPRTAFDDITDAENALRELIISVLGSGDSEDWIDLSGLTTARIERMRSRRVEEGERRQGIAIEQRLLYFADLTDLKTIVDKHWPRFKPCFDDKATFDVFLDRLVDFRTSQMHGRDLLPFERSLATGISGEFRNRITIFRSGAGPTREFFPRIEYVRDSFGNVRHGHGSGFVAAETGLVLHPGDVVTFECRAWDPEGMTFWWQIIFPAVAGGSATYRGDSYQWVVQPQHIAESSGITFYLYSDRPYHRRGSFDDAVAFSYRVLPPA